MRKFFQYFSFLDGFIFQRVMQRHAIAPAALPGLAGTPIAGAVRAGERVFLSGASALNPDGSITGIGDAAAQTHAALDRLEAALKEAGGSLASLTKLTTCIVDRGYRAEVYAVIAQRLPEVRAVSTGLVVAGLALPELIVQIDAEAAIPSSPPRHTRPYTFESWHGQGFPWQGSMVLATDEEFFLRGQTGAGLDHSGVTAKGRGVADSAAQADLAMANLKTLLAEAGSNNAHILMCQIYLANMADFAGMNDIWDDWVAPGDAPPRATVQARLAKAEWRIEVVVTAAIVAGA